MLQRFIRFPEFAKISELNESSTSFRKNSIEMTKIEMQLNLYYQNYENAISIMNCGESGQTFLMNPATDKGNSWYPPERWFGHRKIRTQQDLFIGSCTELHMYTVCFLLSYFWSSARERGNIVQLNFSRTVNTIDSPKEKFTILHLISLTKKRSLRSVVSWFAPGNLRSFS